MATLQSMKPDQILDSGGNPTVEVDILLSSGTFARVDVPNDASSGKDLVLPSVSVPERNWADLPRELLGSILDRLVHLPDYIRFGTVCKPWLCEASIKCQERGRKWPPMLLVPVGDDDQDHRRLYSIWEHKLYSDRFHIPYHRRCSGSSYGWLAFADKDSSFDVSITLLNPFTGSTINLPPIMNIPDYDRPFHDPEYYILKVILSCDPCLHLKDWVAAAVHNEPAEVAFIRSGESSWTYLSPCFYPTNDVCFYQGRLYAVSCRNDLIAIDFSQTRDKQRDEDEDGRDSTKFESLVKSPWPVERTSFLMSYLVEWEGELLLIGRCYLGDDATDDDATIDRTTVREPTNDGKTTVGFKVFKLNHMKPHFGYSDDTAAKWVEIYNIGNFSLFLGDSQPILLSASKFPNLQPNCIYYTDDCQEIDHRLPYEADDMGIFDLATRKVSHYYTLEPSQRYMPASVWISPKILLASLHLQPSVNSASTCIENQQPWFS